MFYDDIILEIGKFLNTDDKIRWFSVCRRHRRLICRSEITRLVKYTSVAQLPFHHIFANLFVENIAEINAVTKIIENNVGRKYTISLHFSINEAINLPRGLCGITFGASFNQPVVLHEGLETINFGFYFNQSVILPNSAKHVAFGTYFNQPVVLPPNLEAITFSLSFNQPVILPSKIKQAFFLSGYKHKLNYPDSLVQLWVRDTYPHDIPRRINVPHRAQDYEKSS